jgi:hypothetical protein
MMIYLAGGGGTELLAVFMIERKKKINQALSQVLVPERT